ncbi:MAG TPA: hypothetical protein VGU27_03545 [Candidatus Eisenbacteria bacterium]|nr:hypothetical protein [Candidatus Eisenbacteria bacterium]
MRRAPVVACAALLVAGPALAAPRPDVTLAAGSTFAADAAPSGGGAAAALALLWPAGERFAFGVEGFADDIGTTTATLVDPNDGATLGTVAAAHRWTFGGAWRGDAALWTRARWQADARALWGVWRVQDDVRGAVRDAVTRVGFGGGLSLRHGFSGGRSLGVALDARRVFPGAHGGAAWVSHYVTAALEWRWQGVRR